MSMTNSIDLANLPAPNVVEEISAEVLLEERLTDLKSRDPAFTALVESDPAYKQLEAATYRETLLRQRVNNAARAVMLAKATGSDLDQIAAYFEVYRIPAAQVVFAGGSGSGATAEVVAEDGKIKAVTITSGGSGYASTPTVTISGSGSGATATASIAGGLVDSILITAEGDGYYPEGDEPFRRRAQLALEGISTAGSEGSYVFHALSADSTVKDVGVYGPVIEPGNVYVTVLSTIGNGTAGAILLGKVSDALNREDVRPLTDNVIVRSAEITEYTVQATLRFYSGPDRAVVLAKAQSMVAEYVAKMHSVGVDIPISGIYSKLHQEGVSNVILTSPTSTIGVDEAHAAYCTSISLVDGGVGE